MWEGKSRHLPVQVSTYTVFISINRLSMRHHMHGRVCVLLFSSIQVCAWLSSCTFFNVCILSCTYSWCRCVWTFSHFKHTKSSVLLVKKIFSKPDFIISVFRVFLFQPLMRKNEAGSIYFSAHCMSGQHSWMYRVCMPGAGGWVIQARTESLSVS